MSESPQTDPYALPPDAIAAPPERLWDALKKIGPGIILAGSIIGSGELLLTTSLGAQFGFAFLWLVLFSCVIKVFVQIELGRYALSSGKPTLAGLQELPGPRFGAHWLAWWWFFMMLATIFQLGAMVGGVGQALNLAFPRISVGLADGLTSSVPSLADAIRSRPEHPWAVLTALAAVALLLSGGYKRIERVTTFLVAGVTLITVGCVAMLPAMDYWITMDDIRKGFSLEVLRLGEDQRAMAIAAAFAAFGITGVGASELFAYPYWCLEKGYARFSGPQSADQAWVDRARGWLRVMRLDAWVSMVVFTIATVSFYILGATVLHRQGLNPKEDRMIETLSEMYVPTFGSWTRIVFLIGAWAVLFKTLYVSSASNSRLAADFFGLAGIANQTQPGWREKWIRRFCVMLPLVGLGLYFMRRDPKAMVIIGGFFQGATLPLISAAAVYLRYRRTDKRLAPSRLSDVFLWLAFLSITAVAIYAIPNWFINKLLPAIREWTA